MGDADARVDPELLAADGERVAQPLGETKGHAPGALLTRLGLGQHGEHAVPDATEEVAWPDRAGRACLGRGRERAPEGGGALRLAEVDHDNGAAVVMGERPLRRRPEAGGVHDPLLERVFGGRFAPAPQGSLLRARPAPRTVSKWPPARQR